MYGNRPCKPCETPRPWKFSQHPLKLHSSNPNWNGGYVLKSANLFVCLAIHYFRDRSPRTRVVVAVGCGGWGCSPTLWGERKINRKQLHALVQHLYHPVTAAAALDGTCTPPQLLLSLLLNLRGVWFGKSQTRVSGHRPQFLFFLF